MIGKKWVQDRPVTERKEKWMRSVLALSLLALLGAGAWTGCARQQKRVEKELASPGAINCATAQGDIRVLRSEKADVAERIAEGVTSVYPAGLVLGVLTGTEGTKMKVAVGDYNKMIDARIGEIRDTCGVE